MVDIIVEKFVDRKKLYDQQMSILETLSEIMGKGKLNQDDYGKLKVARTAAPIIRGIVDMAQQETMMVRASLVAERMKQLGYGTETKQIG